MATDSSARASEYTTAKTNVNNALTKVGRTWTWRNSPSAGSLMQALNMTELQSALDYAHGGIVSSRTNCTTHYGGNYSNNSHNTCSSHNSGYRGVDQSLNWMHRRS